MVGSNERGFSLVESVVAIAMGGLFLAFIASVISLQNQAYADSRESFEIINLQSSLQNSLAAVDQCRCNLSGTSIQGGSAALSQLGVFSVDPSTRACSQASPLVQQGLNNGVLNVSAIRLVNVVATGTSGATGQIQVDVRGTHINRRPILSPRIFFQTQAGVITDCKTMSAGNSLITKLASSSDWTFPGNTYAVYPGWTSAVTDEIGAWNAAQPSRLTVPPGVSRVRLHYSICFVAVAGPMQRDTWIQKNGFGNMHEVAYATVATVGPMVSDSLAVQGHTDVLTVTPGDYFEVGIRSYQVGTDTADGPALCNAVPYFSMEVVQ